MSSFDKKIKDKLESVPVEMDKNAWKNFSRLLPLPWYSVLLKSYLGWIIGAASTGILFYNQYGNNAIIEKIEPKIVYETKYDTIRVVEKDTVYIVNYVKSGPSNTYLADINKVDGGIVGTNDKRKILSKKTQRDEKAENEKAAKTEQIPTLDIAKEQDKTVEAKKEETTTEPDQTKETTEQKEREELKKSDAPVTSETKEKKENELLKQLKSLTLKIGLQSAASSQRWLATGPSIEVLKNKKFGFSTGLLLSNVESNEFSQPIDFNKKTGKRFEEVYRQLVGPKPQSIKEIEINSTVISMPLQFNFYLPITYKLNFLISSGTRLILNKNDEISFEEDAISQERFKNRFDLKNENVRVFSNLNYGMGLSYDINRFNFQFLPTFEFPFKKQGVFSEKNRLMLQLNARFKLGGK